jgi:tetratricopeptide (TPR) repeat protein
MPERHAAWQASWVVLACIVLAVLATVAAPSPAGYNTYLAAVRRYARCDRDAPAVLRPFGPGDIKGVVSEVIRAQPTSPQSETAWPSRQIAAGILLHTQLALGPMDSTRFAHLSAARTLTALLIPADAEYRLIPVWHATAAAMLQGDADVHMLIEHVDRIPRAIQRHPRVLLARAAVDEMLASELVSDADRRRLRGPFDDSGPEWISAQRRAYRDGAIEKLEEVIRADAKEAEAHVRLGFLYLFDGRLIEAGMHASRASALQPIAPLGYYAALLLARTSAARDDWLAAERHYLAARTLEPGSQTPVLGLVRLYLQTGRRSLAVDLVGRRFFDPDRSAAGNDPWWQFPFGQHWRIPSYLEEMRGVLGCPG